MHKKIRILVCIFSLPILLAVACPTPITLTFPSGNCPKEDIQTNITATVIGAAGGTRPRLIVKVCVLCAGAPVTGASVEGEVVATEQFTPPPVIAGVFTFPTTNTAGTGCTEREISLSGLPALLPPGNLVGKEFEVTVKDTAGKVAETKKIIIQEP